MKTISPPKSAHKLLPRSLPGRTYVRYNVHMKKTYTATQARANLFKILDDVQRPDTHITITSDGEPKGVLMSFEEYDSLIETLEVLSDHELMASLKRADEDIKAGRVSTMEDLYKKFNVKP